jgi:hypothetical protein
VLLVVTPRVRLIDRRVPVNAEDGERTSPKRGSMRLPALAVCLVATLVARPSAVRADKAGLQVAATPPTKAGALSLAAKYIEEVTPTLTLEEKQAVDGVVFKLNAQRNVPTFQTDYVDELVNQCTIALANTTGMEAIIVTSAHLLRVAPDSARAANLFGVVLHSIGKDPEAIPVLEYGRTLAPRSELLMLNAANLYLDMDRDERAKALLDQVLKQNDTNKAAYSALAGYWAKRGDLQKTLDALLKASTFGGYVVSKKAEANEAIAAQNTASGSDDLQTIEQMLARTESLTPNTTADLIEDQFPEAARQIRDRYTRLVDDEKMLMPPLPQVNTSGARNWNAKSVPYLLEWQKAFQRNAQDAAFEMGHLEAGINQGDSSQVMAAKAKAAAGPEIARQFAAAEKAIAMLDSMGNIPPAKIAEAKAQFAKAKAEALRKAQASGIDARQPPAGSPSGDGGPDAEAEFVFPGSDYGSVFASTNYRNYLRLRNTYNLYFLKYAQWYSGLVGDIFKVYAKAIGTEDALHQANMDRIAADERRETAITGSIESFELERRRETLRYKQAINRVSDDYFAQWVNVALPQYHDKMKPKLDEFWRVAALYIRNMNQPEVMKREYLNCKHLFWLQGAIAVGQMNAGTFRYYPETDEEARLLDQEVLQSKEDARSKHEEYKRQTKTAEAAFQRWIEDTFSLGVSGEFLSLKVSPRKLTIEEYIAGMNFKHVYDFKTGNWTMYRSFAAKVDIGIQVGPLKVGVSARADILESYDTYNLRSGQLVDCGSSFAKAAASVNAGDPNVGVSHGVSVTLDPAAQNELSARFTHGMSVKDKIGGGVSWSAKAP